MTSPPPTTPSRTARIVAIVAVALLAVVGVGAFFVFMAIGSLGSHTSSRGTGHLEVAGHGAEEGQTTVSVPGRSTRPVGTSSWSRRFH